MQLRSMSPVASSYEVLRRTFPLAAAADTKSRRRVSDANPKDDLAIIHFGSDDFTER